MNLLNYFSKRKRASYLDAVVKQIVGVFHLFSHEQQPLKLGIDIHPAKRSKLRKFHNDKIVSYFFEICSFISATEVSFEAVTITWSPVMAFLTLTYILPVKCQMSPVTSLLHLSELRCKLTVVAPTVEILLIERTVPAASCLSTQLSCLAQFGRPKAGEINK